jgi:proteasome lid subunit RPN8/RPN11
MNEEANNSLDRSLTLAILSCTPELKEEEGGFIIKQIDSEEYEFHKIRNANTGNKVARVLYTVDRETVDNNEFVEKILKKTMLAKKPEWEIFASFHTHPSGFGPFPSQLDLTELFRGHPTNFIYSPDMDMLMRYDFDKEQNQWQAKQINPNQNQKSSSPQNSLSPELAVLEVS